MINRVDVCHVYLEQLVERAETAGGDHERLAVVEHPELSREKVVELER